METEDFSFPTLGSTSSRYIDSPPLWHASPAASPGPEKAQETAKKKQSNEYKEEELSFVSKLKVKSCGQRKGFSYVKMVKGDDQDGDDEEERMDLLWENFNDESSKSRNLASGEIKEFGCVQGLKLVKSRGGVRKPGVVVILKVLKKFLLLHNSHRATIKKPA